MPHSPFFPTKKKKEKRKKGGRVGGVGGGGGGAGCNNPFSTGVPDLTFFHCDIHAELMALMHR